MLNLPKLTKLITISILICFVGTGLISTYVDARHQPESYAYHDITRVSVANDGTEGNGDSCSPSISGDGQLTVFRTLADNLVSGDLDGESDIILYDHQTKAISNITWGVHRTTYAPFISVDGLFITFTSQYCSGTLMIQSCTTNIRLYDIAGDQFIEVAEGYSNGISVFDYVSNPSVSSGGRFVAYVASAIHLESDPNPYRNSIFLRDTLLEQTNQISVASDGTKGNGSSINPSISANGQYVVFDSTSDNLVVNDTNSARDVFLHDIQTGDTTRVSVVSDGSEGNDISSDPSISSDGRYIAFESAATNLVPGDTNGVDDIFVHDTQTGNTIRVTIASDGTQGNSSSSGPSVSSDGQTVAFSSSASNLVTEDTNEVSDIFVHQIQTGQTSLVSSDNLGNQGNGHSSAPAISGNAQYVAFESSADNLVAGDTNGVDDVFLRNQELVEITFSDVLPSYWAFDWIEGIAAAGLTSGYPDGTYRPANPVTRAEMAVFLLGGMGISPPAMDGSHPFSDIAGHWAEAYIEELYDQGITGGYPDDTYRPENQVTRAEMAIFLLKGIGVSPPPLDGSHPFSDVAGHWAEIFIEELYDQGITGGYPDGTYRPQNQVTRAEMAVFLVKTFNIPIP